MIILKLATNGLDLIKLETSLVTSDNKKSVSLEVTFDDSWTGYGKSATFKSSSSNKIYEVPLADNACVVPWEVLESVGTMSVGVRGVKDDGSVIASDLVDYKIAQGAKTGDGTSEDPTPTVYEQLLSNYSSVDQKITVERKRIDNIVKLPSGSTSGDAELIDIRIGADGNTYDSAGTAVREQVSELKEDLDKLNEGGLKLKDEVIAEDVSNWLDEHPEATTTVQDGAITEPKIHSNFLPYIKNGYVTPEMFGAVGDGLTDDSYAFQEAMLSDKDIICTKKYYISKAIYTNFGKKIIGINGAEIRLENNDASINIISKEVSSLFNAKIQNIKFIGNGSNTCVRIGTRDLKVTNSKVGDENHQAYNINFSITDCIFENCLIGCDVTKMFCGVISHNSFNNSCDTGIILYCSDNCVIEKNRISSKTGIYTLSNSDEGGSFGSNCKIVYNDLVNCANIFIRSMSNNPYISDNFIEQISEMSEDAVIFIGNTQKAIIERNQIQKSDNTKYDVHFLDNKLQFLSVTDNGRIRFVYQNKYKFENCNYFAYVDGKYYRKQYYFDRNVQSKIFIRTDDTINENNLVLSPATGGLILREGSVYYESAKNVTVKNNCFVLPPGETLRFCAIAMTNYNDSGVQYPRLSSRNLMIESGKYIRPTVPNGFYYFCIKSGTTGEEKVPYDTNIGSTFYDGTAQIRCEGYLAEGTFDIDIVASSALGNQNISVNANQGESKLITLSSYMKRYAVYENNISAGSDTIVTVKNDSEKDVYISKILLVRK